MASHIISDVDVMRAVKNDAPSHVVVNILRRWRGWRGEAKIGRSLGSVLEDVDILNLGIRAWIPDEKLFEVKSDFEAFLSKTKDSEGIPGLSLVDMPVLEGFGSTEYGHVKAWSPADEVKEFEGWIDLFRCFPNLEILDLSMGFGYTERYPLKSKEMLLICQALESGAFTSLLSLDLAYNVIDPECMAHLGRALESGALASLQLLRLAHNPIGAEGMDHLCRALESGALAKLLSLDLMGTRIDPEGMDRLCRALESGALVSLLSLNLGGNSIGDEGMGHLCRALKSGALVSLKLLILSHSSIGDEGMVHLCGALESGALGLLESFDLSYCSIGAEGMRHLSRALESGALPSLLSLNLQDNKIEDEGMRYLCRALESGALATLQSLNIHRTSAEVEDIEQIIASGALPCLQTTLNGTPLHRKTA